MIEYELGGTVTFDFLPAGLTCHLRLSARARLFRRGGRAGRGGLLTWLFLGSMMSRRSHGRHSTGWHGGSVGGAFGGFGGGGGFSGGGASGGW